MPTTTPAVGPSLVESPNFTGVVDPRHQLVDWRAATIARLDDDIAGREGAPHWRLSLLGGFELRVDGRPANIGQASERLVAYLALLEKPATRSAVAGGLWPDATEDHAKASLRTALWKLGRHRGSLISTSGHYLVLAAAVDVDLAESDELARAVIAGKVGDLADPLRCFGADLLPDWHDEWLEVDRERFRQLRLHALEAICQRQTDAGCFAAAVDAGLSAVNADPFRESSRRALIRAYLGEGNRRDAMRQFDAFRTLLSEELGAEPSVEITRLASDAFPYRRSTSR